MRVMAIERRRGFFVYMPPSMTEKVPDFSLLYSGSGRSKFSLTLFEMRQNKRKNPFCIRSC